MSSASASRKLQSQERVLFQRRLLRWYDREKRDLPWRQDRDPYRVWISEIMLQQTRVAAAIGYYGRFLKRFPTVRALAAARASSVLAAWSGLGYYRRARALHQAAKTIARERAGKFPESAEEWRALPGIGRYTAAAIASIALDQPVAVVDGNVERVLARVLGRELSRDEAWSVAGERLSRSRPGDFNQAMMELGATVCLPRQPKCLGCPVVELCSTRGQTPAKAKELRRRREVHYALQQHNGSVLLVQRPAGASLMPGMWELPEVTSPNGDHPVSFTVRHSITVTDYTVRVTSGPAPQEIAAKWIQTSRLNSLPLTGLTRKILRRASII